MRRRIAVLVAQIDETTQKRFLTEFIKEAYAYEYDVCIFSMYQKFQETMLRNTGDSNIFKLVNYDLFDAVLVLADTILTPGLALPLQKNIKEHFSGPVLVVDQKSPYFESVMMDHYTPVRKIVDHLIEVHGYKDIAFLGGKEGHPHSVQRLNGFRDSMKEHGLEIRDEWIYHGNYWYDSAEEFADILLMNTSRLPQAIACANDCMAIGMATRLSERGIRVPQDIAITGYDSIEDGRHSPAPITSADIPAGECGRYCLQWLHAKVNEVDPPKFVCDAPIFTGASCGCEYEPEMVPKELRSEWRTQQSSRSLFSDFNHSLEDLLAQKNFRGFLEVVREYAYQIRPFYSFDICMNEGFLRSDLFVGENALRDGYTSTMYKVLSCNSRREEEGVIDFDEAFPVKELVPGLTNERRYPTTYIFNPIYFDDRCFGYTVLNQGPKVVLYNEGYRIWMRNVMQGMEAFYRQRYMFELVERIKADQIRDSLTGLYNYEGFLKNSSYLIDQQNDKLSVNILTIDIKGMKPINEIYGRACGERAIRAVGRFIQNAIGEDEICCRMCNDEFLVALLDDEDESRSKKIVEEINADISGYRLLEETEYQLKIHAANLRERPLTQADVEAQVNRAISIKNHNKNAVTQKTSKGAQDVMADIERNQLVMNILNDNLFVYYYQPIVSAVDGRIYAYEALMRYEAKKISPPQIIQSAAYMNRLSDIERATLLNVTKNVEDNIGLFGDAKVFINSLPGIELSKKDDKIFSQRLLNNRGRFVIEFTEESELDDEKLEKLKDKYEKLGSFTAVDDYGAGYSNVNNLLRYMPHYVKIDRMLISQLQINPQKQHMVKSIIDFAHDNNIIALVEGVETKEEMQECIRLGADLIQGYYTGKPARKPVGEIDEAVRGEITRSYNGKNWGI